MSLNVNQVICRALRMHGVIDTAVTAPPADVAADMLTAANAMKRAWFGTLIGPRLSPIALAGTAGQAENGGEYTLPAAAFTLTAPLNPAPGNRFGILDVLGDFSTYPCTINPNGRAFSGISGGGNLVFETNGQSDRFWYRGDTGTWIAEADWAGLTSTIEFPDPIIAYMPYMLAAEVASEFGQDITPEMAQGAMEGRMVLARSYARRGPAGLDPVIGLAGPPQPPGPPQR